MLSLIISMLMKARCMFPFHQATLLQHWMVYNHVWLLSSHGCRQINWNWTHIKRNSFSLGMKATEQVSFYVSNRVFECWNLPSKICLQSWIDLWQKLPLTHISAICSSCIYHIRDLRRIRRHLDLDGAKLLANALVSSRFDYCNSLLFWGWGNWPHQAPTCFEPSGSCGHKLTTIYSQCSTAALPSLATSKI